MDPTVGYWPVRDGQPGFPVTTASALSRKMREAYTSIPLLGPKRSTTDPIVTGTSVLAIKYKDGVMLAADTHASYGNMSRFRGLQRMHVIGTHTLIGFSGELSDYQMILEELDKMMTKEYCADDGYKFCAQEIFSYMSRVMYGKRNEMNPYYNTLLIAGLDTKGESFLGMIDPVGTTLTDDEFATGYGLYLARPLMRKEKDERKKAGLGDMSEDEAKKHLENCLRVMYYRDTRASNRIQVAKVTKEGAVVSDMYELETNWDIGKGVKH